MPGVWLVLTFLVLFGILQEIVLVGPLAILLYGPFVVLLVIAKRRLEKDERERREREINEFNDIFHFGGNKGA